MKVPASPWFSLTSALIVGAALLLVFPLKLLPSLLAGLLVFELVNRLARPMPVSYTHLTLPTKA